MARQPFTFYIIAEPNSEHTPCLMSRNGKQALYERTKRARDIDNTWHKMIGWAANQLPFAHRITRADFNKLYPNGPAKNSGPKRKPKTFIALAGKYKGQKVTVRTKAIPNECPASDDDQWVTHADGTPGTYLKIHLKPVKSTTKSGKR